MPETATSQAPASQPFLSERDGATLLDEETLDLSVPEPVPTAHLALQPNQPGRLASGCWALAPGQQLNLKLRLAEEDQLTLTFELYVPDDPAIRAVYQDLRLSDWQAPLFFQTRWGGPELPRPWSGRQSLVMKLSGDPLAQSFLKLTTPLLPLPEVGENDCTLWYDREALKTLFIRAVTLKRFRVQRQEQTQWCWAAVTASLLSLLDPNNQTQSEIVQRSLTGDDLNRPQDITAIAKKLGLAVKYTSRQLALYELRDGIKQGLPIPLQINWRMPDGEVGEAGHYVVLTGIGPDVAEEDQTLIKIEDPSKGELQMTFAELKNDYPGAANKHLYSSEKSGVWTWTHRIEKKTARQKAVKYRAPTLKTSAARHDFARQWEASRPPEGPGERIAAVEAELARLQELSELESRHRKHTYAWGEQLESAVTAREQRLLALFQHHLRLLWVRELLPPLGVLGPPASVAWPGEPKRPSFFDKKE